MIVYRVITKYICSLFVFKIVTAVKIHQKAWTTHCRCTLLKVQRKHTIFSNFFEWYVKGPPDVILQLRKGRRAPPAWIIRMLPTEHSSEAFNNGEYLFHLVAFINLNLHYGSQACLFRESLEYCPLKNFHFDRDKY